MAEVHHQCASGFIQENLPFDELDSAKSHRFFSSQFWQEKIWEKYPADEYLLGGEILKSEADGLVATGVPGFVVNSMEIKKLTGEICQLRSEISDLKRAVNSEK